MKAAKNKPDYYLFAIVAVLILFGLAIIASVSASISPDNPMFYLFRHIKRGLIPGLLLGFAAFKMPLPLLRKWSFALLLFSLFLTALVFVPGIGIHMGGATRWINLGLVTFQPSELLKLSFILYLAAWLAARTAEPESKKRELVFKKLGSWSNTTLFAFLAIMGIIVLLLIKQPDASTLVLIAACAFLMYFLAQTPLKHSLLIIGLGICGLFFLVGTGSYRFARMLVFWDRGTDPMGLGFQINQAIITIGSGGIFGTGFGMGIQRFLPQPLADSIFAVFAEQAGFIGSSALIILFVLFFWRGWVIAKKSGDNFCKLTALGISFWIILQAFVHIGVSLGLVPVTGIPLPFISYGGTAMAISLIGVGILLNISKNVGKNQNI